MKKILYVEDDAINALVMKQILKKRYEVVQVGDAESCLLLLEQEKFDLVLMDIHLGNGKMDGIQAMKEIKKKISGDLMPVIAVTSYALPEDEDKFLADGFDGYLSKPIEKEVLFEYLLRYL